MSLRRRISLILMMAVIVASFFLYLYNQTYSATGTFTKEQTIKIEKGENALEVGEKMENSGIIKNKYLLIYYLWQNGQIRSIVAGVYIFSPGMKIPEIARIITGGETASTAISLTFPEGWTLEDMAKRLNENGFSGDEFLTQANNPSVEIKEKFTFLKTLPKNSSLEGYLFPDTYFFAKDASSQQIIEKMLANFDTKVTEKMLADISSQKKDLHEIIIMASIIEKEAKYADEMKTVSSVFYNRLKIGQRLQSDATLEYVLKDKKIQHSIEETKNQSPYNTYQFEGLPPGPVANPGINAINAAIYPIESDYFYFLTDLKTMKTIFSKTFEEHVANKARYGL